MPGLRNKRVSITADTRGIEPEKAIRFLKEGDVRVNAVCLGYILKLMQQVEYISEMLRLCKE